MFTSAGMVPFKPYFMGLAEPPGRRLISIQKCFRMTDIEEVGNVRNHTFFEMLGNFSFGDYFKEEVIPWAWELLTTPQPKGLGLDNDRIWATIFKDDDEAFEIWREVGVPEERIVRYGEKENYWFAGGPNGPGPCGPNSEINYDFGVEFGCGNPDCHPNCDRLVPGTNDTCMRFLELWNLVFMTLYQAEDGTRTPLPQKNVDTGAGLERWAVPVMWQNRIDWQGRPKEWTTRPSNYDTDLFQPILLKVGDLAGKSYEDTRDEERRAMRIVAEHARAATFLIADGVTPANDGRGYVLRRLIRRGTTFGQRLSEGKQFLADTAERVMEIMAEEHPLLAEQRRFVLQVLRSEENRFFETVRRGGAILSGMIEYRKVHAKGFEEALSFAEQRGDLDPENASLVLDQHGMVGWHVESSPERRIGEEMAATDAVERFSQALEAVRSGNRVPQSTRDWPRTLGTHELFYLYDTFGFPPELAAEIGREHGLEADPSSVTGYMEAQRARSRAATRFEGDAQRIQTYSELALPPTRFVGYEHMHAKGTVQAILHYGSVVQSLNAEQAAGGRIEVVLDATPFYAEAGGQVGDTGEICWPGGCFVVEDTQAVGEGGVVAHIGRLDAGTLSVGDEVETNVDEDKRGDTMRNHTATHILHAALRHILGSHVRQAGSLVAPDRLRFDFTHLEALKPQEIAEVERLANRVVRENIPVSIRYESYEEALAGGALAFFGEKYAERVRVVGICDIHGPACFSKELCGGTHCHASGEVGAIVIVGESSIGAGMRRIEALSGRAAIEHLRQQEALVATLSGTLRAPPGELVSRVRALQDEIDSLNKRLQAVERRAARDESESIAAQAEQIDGVNLLAARVSAPNVDFLRGLGDGLKTRLGSAVILLGAEIGGKPTFIAMSTPDVARRVSAGDIVRVAAQAAGGGGGGRPELAQGGGADVTRLDDALEAGRKLAEDKLRASP
jgi:alanyl-tRNA synthetase